MRELLEKITKETSAYLRELSGREGLDKVIGTHGDDTTKVVDRLAEDFILENLRKEDLRITVVTEETGFIGRSGSEYVAVIDPLDGSTNYLNGITWAGVSIALFKRDGSPVAGAVSEIFSGRTYSYDQERAYVDGRIFTGISNPQTRIVLSYFDRSRLREAMGILSAIEGGYKTRNLGSASLDMLLTCTGRAYLFFDIRNKLRNVDIASSSNFCKKVSINPMSLEGKSIDINLEGVTTIKSVVVSPDSSLLRRIFSGLRALPS
ncbi:MAG: inositol monophosphatase family protein [Metallosphaera yellowstonensis]|jgi:Archaeal fructose-1,6-bisphosphatase and related enzymes of inositol monophosphatase family